MSIRNLLMPNQYNVYANTLNSTTINSSTINSDNITINNSASIADINSDTATITQLDATTANITNLVLPLPLDYTPTIAGSVNIVTSNIIFAYYTNFGTHVQVWLSGQLQTGATGSAFATFDLPPGNANPPNNFSTNIEIIGTGSFFDIASTYSTPLLPYSTIGTRQVTLFFNAGNTNLNNFTVSFTYLN